MGCVSILHGRVGAGKEVLSQESRSIFHPVIQMSSAISLSLYTKGQLISKELFGVIVSTKKIRRPPEAAISTSATSIGYQILAKDLSFHMRLCLLL